jgi:energy-coupling factor transporter ATP-binding protein EcfA2
MIKLGILHVEEFRGIRELEIDFKYESYTIHGPNGSGKSGIVDAIGFALTGTITRLKGDGTAAVSLKQHAPHAKSKDNPEAAKVSLTFKDVASGQVGTITRTVKDPVTFSLSPDTPELRNALQNAIEHPELTLSRREIIKYILATPNKRAAEVQTLLQLDKLEINRKALKSAHNKIKADLQNAKIASISTRQAVETHLDIQELTPDKVRDTVNPYRKLLGLTEFNEVNLSTNLREGLDEYIESKSFDKQTALREIATYQAHIRNPIAIKTAVNELMDAVKEITKGSDLALLKNRTFFETGLDLIADDGICPLCDTAWHTIEELRTHLVEKIEGSKELVRIDSNIATKMTALKSALREERMALKSPHMLSIAWLPIEDQEILYARLELLLEFEALLKDTQGAISLQERLEAGALAHDDELQQSLVRLNEKITSQPDTSQKAKARSHLDLAAERWTNFAKARMNEELMQAAEKRSENAYNEYHKVIDLYLDDLYTSVESRFSAFYSYINKDDESDFKAALKPESGKLDMLVDFYGLGMFPPGAYHSEGHQDGMGICLYLALVEKVQGKSFTLSVLDDVVMSVDVDHRRQFCKLLKEEFPSTQFILTTHDAIWAKQMQTTGLIKPKANMQFRGWSVNSGPIYEQGQVFWDKIEEDLNSNNIPAAAANLRRGLEAELPDIAEALGGRVAYRGDAKYELNDFLDAVKGRHGDLLRMASASADSWKNVTEQNKIEELKKTRAATLLAQDREQWAVNLQVHFNDWAQMSAADFRPVVIAWEEFIKLFSCTNSACSTWISVKGRSGMEESLRCRCGEYNLNLIKK